MLNSVDSGLSEGSFRNSLGKNNIKLLKSIKPNLERQNSRFQLVENGVEKKTGADLGRRVVSYDAKDNVLVARVVGFLERGQLVQHTAERPHV